MNQKKNNVGISATAQKQQPAATAAGELSSLARPLSASGKTGEQWMEGKDERKIIPSSPPLILLALYPNEKRPLVLAHSILVFYTHYHEPLRDPGFFFRGASSSFGLLAMRRRCGDDGARSIDSLKRRGSRRRAPQGTLETENRSMRKGGGGSHLLTLPWPFLARSLRSCLDSAGGRRACVESTAGAVTACW